MDSNGFLLERLEFAVLLRKLHSKQSACFMVFTKGPINRGFATSDRPQNDSKMNSAMEPQKLEFRYSFGDAESRSRVGFRYLGRTTLVMEQKFEIGRAE
jgi:hypothetical protein